MGRTWCTSAGAENCDNKMGMSQKAGTFAASWIFLTLTVVQFSPRLCVPLSGPVLPLVAACGALLRRHPLHKTQPPLARGLRLRGGGGVFDGQLSEAHGLGRVSESLRMRERMGGNCRDPPNVPPDITSHHHVDSLSPQYLYESIGTEEALTASGELTNEWEEQGRNFLKAHVARGAAMIADMGGASLHLTRALHKKFDADGDGFMQRQDIEALLAATEPKVYQEQQERSPGVDRVTIDVWQHILNETASDPAAGLTVDGLVYLYSLPGEDLRKDCWTVFGTEGMAHIPFYNPLFDIFPDPNMFRAAAAEQQAQNTSNTLPSARAEIGGGAKSDTEEGGGPKLRRWLLEEGTVPPNHDVWDDKTLEELAPSADPSRPNQCWHEQDWSAVDLRMLRDFLLETSLKADCKQRPLQEEAPDPPIMHPPGMLLHRPFSPVEAFGRTWSEYMSQCRLPEHVGLGGRHYNYSEYDRQIALEESWHLTRSHATWRSCPSVVTWSTFLEPQRSTLFPPPSSPALSPSPTPSPASSFTPPSSSAASASSTSPPQDTETPMTMHGKETRRDGGMREEATKMLRQIAAHFGVQDAYSLSFEQLSPYLDDDGEIVLPKWLSWDDLREMENLAEWDRDLIAQICSPSMNGMNSLNGGGEDENMTVAAAQKLVDSHHPVFILYLYWW